MEYRSILVHLDNSERARGCVDIALQIAQQHDAHVSALCAPAAIEHRLDYVFTFGTEYWDRQMSEEDDHRRALEHYFLQRLADAKLKGEWHTALQNAEREMMARARYADLIVLRQSDPENPNASLGNRFQTRLTLAAGRPVLWVPYTGQFPSIGKRIVVAWDAGQSATRALYDALPFMRQAQQTSLVTFTLPNSERSRIPGADMGLVLARHGIQVEVAALHPPPTVSVEEALLSTVQKNGCDLLVMGAYGHARWREILLGGVTHAVMGLMPVPVLMSH
ncbi:nucleotide-binding universal stress UspA family protein [Paraburkholderia bannensis]|uniref:Nucleotide-binding universal stress UspA family protein n=1 Tax=Paraburkholderia bannensis TaxID=765414 RepID=A0A7W9TZK2_9BURK|nr:MULTISPECIES: universal stress protein [Paraburkholderia]MBB3258122.1 nucleotide-binding universal stress UspA family protein [Paraburkholderia sp. WP4_3_2]MBB6103135.1 nucleotide-binding universal stress UspA family protein [Paraburkholderia bannensis]